MPVLTRNASLSGLNGLPSQVTTIDELQKTIQILDGFLNQLELPPSGLKIGQSDLGTANLTKTLKEFAPKVQAAVEANVIQSKALAKVLGAVTGCLSFVCSDDYAEIIVDKVLASEGLEDLIATKVQDKVEELGGSGGGRKRRGATSSVAPETPMRAQRMMKLENPLHWAVHRLVHKAYSRNGKTVSSPLTTWPDMEEDGWLMEDVAGVQVKRWRPDWNATPEDTPFEKAVLRLLADEFEGTLAVNDIKVRLKSYMSSISRAKREAEAGVTEQKKASTNMLKRQKWLFDNMRANFETSVLNQCDERALYRAMIFSGAFVITTAKYSEPHGLSKVDTIQADGTEVGYDLFEILADIWFGVPTDPHTVAMVKEPGWWSNKARKAFWILAEECQRVEKGKVSNIPLFHVPAAYRAPPTLATLPPIAVPSSGPADSPSASKKAKVEVFALSEGMVNEGVLQSLTGDFSTWTVLLADDPERETDLPPLDELLKREDKRELARRAEAHLYVPSSISPEHLRKFWDVKRRGSQELYAQVLRGENPAKKVTEVTEEELDDSLYE